MALRLLDAAGLDAPTVEEVDEWYTGNPTGGDDEEGGGELNERDFADIFGDR